MSTSTLRIVPGAKCWSRVRPFLRLRTGIGSLLITGLKNESIGLQVETVSFGNDEENKDVEIICRAIACERNIKQPVSIPQAEFLSFELWIKKDKESFIKLSDLAFNADHERFWGNLPTDEEVYHFAEPDDEKLPQWTRAAEAVNFTLAGTSSDRETFYWKRLMRNYFSTGN